MHYIHLIKKHHSPPSISLSVLILYLSRVLGINLTHLLNIFVSMSSYTYAINLYQLRIGLLPLSLNSFNMAKTCSIRQTSPIFKIESLCFESTAQQASSATGILWFVAGLSCLAAILPYFSARLLYSL